MSRFLRSVEVQTLPESAQVIQPTVGPVRYSVISCVTGETSAMRADLEIPEGWTVIFTGTKEECLRLWYQMEGIWHRHSGHVAAQRQDAE